MDERVIQFRVGVMVVATLIITAILVLLFGERQSPFRTTRTVYIKFPETPGVGTNTPIQNKGILIGRVTSVRSDEDSVLVIAEINADQEIRHNQVCRISTSLLGDAVLRFVRSNDPNAPATPVESGELIKGVVAPDPIQVVSDLQQSLSEAIGSVAKTSEDLDQVVRRIGNLLKSNEQRIDRIIAQTDETMAVVRKAVNSANEMVSDPELKEKLRQTVEQMPLLLRTTRETLNRMNETFALVDKNLQNMEGFTRAMGENGPNIVGRLDQGAQKLDLLMDQMLKFSKDLNDQQGTLGQLIHNPELYDNLNRAVANVEEMSRQLKPILNDARVFSDKIARHPETLGVRGVIERKPGIK